LEAEITLEYDLEKTARAVARAVSPDNFKTPRGLSVRTTLGGKKVVTHIAWHGELPTLMATIDDLLSCVSTAERTLHAAKKFE
jgi:tRNA threonylcarbamoyladenosine modification (KEOPS) complex  Pcc1 subunit